MKPINKKCIVSIAFANYLNDKTGVPKVMMAHQGLYNERDISYLAMFAVKKTLKKDDQLLFCKFGIILDGEFKGIFQMSQIINMLVDWMNEDIDVMDIHLHHLMYIKLGLVNQLLTAFYDVPIKVYLHDYYNACTNYNLMREKKEYCGGYGLKEEYCQGCSSYSDSVRVQTNIHEMYAKHLKRITFISPSENTRKIFLRFHPEYSQQTIVLPHQIFDTYYQGNLEPVGVDEKIRVAYLGMPVMHKGWDVWEKLVNSVPKSQYEFIVFNSANEEYPGMKKIDIAFSSDNLNAMTSALRNEKVHVALFWAKCQETYSYTCFEAYAANAFLVTRKNSGNLAEVVKERKCGTVLETEEELFEYFANPNKVRKQITDFRQNTCGGPENLFDNPEIVALSLKGCGKSRRGKYKKIIKPVNYPLLWVLNLLYKR